MIQYNRWGMEDRVKELENESGEDMNKEKSCKNCEGCALFRLIGKDESFGCKYFKNKEGEKE